MSKASKQNQSIRVALDSIGCKLNQAEAELLAREFAEAGCTLVSPGDQADIYVLNTCTVTHVADRKSRQRLRQARGRNPEALLVAAGCFAERAPRDLAGVCGAGLVVGNEPKPHLVKLLKEAGYIDNAGCGLPAASYPVMRTRAFIKVQDGCNNFCAYCIVPLVRGGEKSLPVEQVITEVRQRTAGGYKEIVLTGTEIGSYKYNEVNLRGLLERILREAAITRVRLSSLQPQEITPGLIGLWRDERLCPHFHLSLQSGSDGVLRRMKRRYTAADYRRALSLVRASLPDAAITTDIIVGFPGETDEEFAESYDFCREAGFARIHVFPYSPRPGTEAARMRPQVADKMKKQRSQKMLALAEDSAQKFRRQFLGRTMPVLWEKQSRGIWSGLTDNYIRVYTRSSEDLTNKLLPAKLVEARGDGVWGNI